MANVYVHCDASCESCFIVNNFVVYYLWIDNADDFRDVEVVFIWCGVICGAPFVADHAFVHVIGFDAVCDKETVGKGDDFSIRWHI